MDKVSYSFVKENKNVVFRSKVESFGLDHVTEKDIRSFYANFSQHSAFDTGLIPLDGTGLLSIRKAGSYTQVAYQHKPGQYYVNWGSREADPEAKKYLFAQPYRIVIIDFKDNNLLGARTFYSMIPVTYPDVQLYHVNLPNINCKGYKGNGVGWICLYHNTDWSQLPFNERLALAIERCSGVESYNDANMNETDGPRFYQEMFQNDKSFSYLWNPYAWEEKSQKEGFEWTLSAHWIPVMVKDIDSQDRHYTGFDAKPLTFKMALTGSYQAYYTDKVLLKPINALQRNAGIIDTKDIMNYFVQSYNNSFTTYSGVDTFDKSDIFRNQRSQNSLGAHEDYEEPEPEHDEDESDEDGPF